MKGISYDTEGQHYGAHFKSTMTMDHVLADASTSAWKNSVNMLFNPSTLCSLDDDHLHLRAKRNTALGLVRKHNPHTCKGYGPDQHVCTSVGTNCILAAQVESKSTGLNACLQNLLDIIAHGSKDNTLNHDIALDRGYSSIDNVNRCAMVGLRNTGTVKCNAGPFTNKQPSSLNGRPMKQQCIVSEGHANVYCATHEVVGKSQNEKERVLSVAVRNGTGKVIFLQTASTKIKPFSYDVIFDERHDKPVPTYSVEDKIRCMKFTDFLNGINQLTVTQRTADWFLLCKFLFTGTTAKNALKAYAKHFNANWKFTTLSGYQSLEYFNW